MLHACGLELEDLAAYAIHKNTQTIKKYARQNPINLHRRIAQADTLSTVIEGLHDPEAAAQGAPSVRWFLGYDADGTPQFCGLPALPYLPAPDGLLTLRFVHRWQAGEISDPAQRGVPDQSSRSERRTAQRVGDLATEDAHAQLRLVADDLIATLAEQCGKVGRNVAITALRKRLAFVQGLIQRRNVPLDPPDAATLGPKSGTHPI